jgi:NAD(P)H-dependent FMN reductase
MEETVARILAFSGSTRAGSYNQRLASLAARAAEAAGAQVRLLCLKSYALPVYDADFEADYGLVDNVLVLKREFDQADGFLIAVPEHNGSIPAVLKNALDWVSRPCADEPPIAVRCFRGKVAALLSASPEPLGGVSALVHVRQILTQLLVTVLPEQVCIPFADKAFDEAGLKDAALRSQVEDLGRRITRFAAHAEPA